MTRRTRVSAPGKLILIGEHAVVYGHPALVAAVDLRLEVDVEDGETGGVRLDLPGIGVRDRFDWPEIEAYTSEARRRWQRFALHPSAAAFRDVRGDDPAHVVKVALGEAAVAGLPTPGLAIRLESRIPLGAGLGSSSAAAVGVLAAVLRHAGLACGSERLDELALEVERRQHGFPSGADHRTVLCGGVLWARRSGGSVDAEPVSLDPAALARLQVFDSGPPAEDTGTIVAAVRDRRAAEPGRFERLLETMGSLTRGLRDQLTGAGEGDAAMVSLVRDYQRCLEELGVVPEPVRELIRRIEAAGGAGKVSGAGALTGDGAGCLLVYHADPSAIASWRFMDRLKHYPVRLGVEGLRWDH